MTKEDAIKKMESMKQTFIDLHTPQQMKKKESKRVMEAYDMAIKIRAEINRLTVYYTTDDKGINLISKNAVNRIFDKYKVGSEDKE